MVGEASSPAFQKDLGKGPETSDQIRSDARGFDDAAILGRIAEDRTAKPPVLFEKAIARQCGFTYPPFRSVSTFGICGVDCEKASGSARRQLLRGRTHATGFIRRLQPRPIFFSASLRGPFRGLGADVVSSRPALSRTHRELAMMRRRGECLHCTSAVGRCNLAQHPKRPRDSRRCLAMGEIPPRPHGQLRPAMVQHCVVEYLPWRCPLRQWHSRRPANEAIERGARWASFILCNIAWPARRSCAGFRNKYSRSEGCQSSRPLPGQASSIGPRRGNSSNGVNSCPNMSAGRYTARVQCGHIGDRLIIVITAACDHRVDQIQ